MARQRRAARFTARRRTLSMNERALEITDQIGCRGARHGRIGLGAPFDGIAAGVTGEVLRQAFRQGRQVGLRRDAVLNLFSGRNRGRVFLRPGGAAEREDQSKS